MAAFNAQDYIDVQDRITRFWAEHKNGSINTFLLASTPDNTDVIIKAEIRKLRDNPLPDATGIAQESKAVGGKGANVTSWVENGETSAIGRALANMGYAVSNKDRPSRQEMEKVQRGQQQAHTDPASQPAARQQRAQAAPAPTAVRPAAQPAPGETGELIDESGRKALEYIRSKKGLTHDQMRDLARQRYGVQSSKDLTVTQGRDLWAHINDLPDSPAQGGN